MTDYLCHSSRLFHLFSPVTLLRRVLSAYSWILLYIDKPLKNSLAALFIEELPTQSLDSGTGQKASAIECQLIFSFLVSSPEPQIQVWVVLVGELPSCGRDLGEVLFCLHYYFTKGAFRPRMLPSPHLVRPLIKFHKTAKVDLMKLWLSLCTKALPDLMAWWSSPSWQTLCSHINGYLRVYFLSRQLWASLGRFCSPAFVLLLSPVWRLYVIAVVQPVVLG